MLPGCFRGVAAISFISLHLAAGVGLAAKVQSPAGQDKPTPEQTPPTDSGRFNRMPTEPFRVREDIQTVAASEAPLEDGDLVIGVVVGKEARAYPINFLIGPRNEILNDKLGGDPVAVTWCSVNRSPCVYNRSMDDRVLTLGVKGIRQATLIMYDTQTESSWAQLVGEALEGPLKGRILPRVPSILTTWGLWKSLHPQTTAYVDWAGPYYSNFSPGTIRGFAERGPGSVEAEDLVIGVEAGPTAKAYAVKDLARQKVLNDRVGETPLVVMFDPDFTTVRVFSAKVEQRDLTFRLEPKGRLVDDQTGSVWDSRSLEGVSGPLKGKLLEPLAAVLSLWQGWKLYRPKTELYSPGQ